MASARPTPTAHLIDWWVSEVVIFRTERFFPQEMEEDGKKSPGDYFA